MQPSCGTHSFEFNQRLHVSFPGGSVEKNLPANTGDMGSIPGLRRSPGEQNANSNSFAWEMPGTEELGRPKRVRHDLATK